ncbi:MAG: ATP-binding protein [Pseudomonadota bacterium]
MTETPQEHRWRALSIFILYRLIIASSLAGVFQLEIGPSYLGRSSPILYTTVSALYLLFALICPVAVKLRKPNHDTQVIIQVATDITAIVLIMHASGGITSGLGTLLAISVTSAGILLGNNSALAFAAAATLSLFAEQSIAIIYGLRTETTFTLSGIHGAVFFSTTLLAMMLGNRVRISEAMAAKSREQMERLQKLNENVIHFMQAGLIVVDQLGGVRLCNDAAKRLLKLKHEKHFFELTAMSPELSDQFERWLSEEEPLSEFCPDENDKRILPSINTISVENQEPLYILFLEDTSFLQSHAQNLKLASLGRLTGSIAHEIRNPLGAASHAAQLLSESEHLDNSDQSLVDMIQRHCLRMNSIIEAIMATSQRKQAELQHIRLLPFLVQFIEEFSINRQPVPEITIESAIDDVSIKFDPNHFIQILTNLVDNGIRYSIEHTGQPTIQLKVEVNGNTGRFYLDILDNGKGVESKVAEKLFEPFFTTSHSGTGLGLYLSRELCVANRSQLQLIPVDKGTCFRISFPK